MRDPTSDADRIIRIVMLVALPCGYLRLDRDGECCARVSICLSPEARGQGLGRWLLEEADRVGRRIGIERLNAEIHPKNAASRRVFGDAGYMRGNSDDEFLTCYRTLEYAT